MKKTKKIAFATLVCSVALTGAIAFAACDGTTEPTAHNHKWSAWTVEEANKPTTTAGGKATRTCTGEGECDAVAAQKEYALPALNETDYTKSTKTTATCLTDGVVTYTYNKNGVQVAVDVNVGKDATNHEADCGHVAHVHNWGDGWTVIEENYPTKTAKGKATRTCSAEGCNATAADTEYVLPELTSDKYTKNGQDASCAIDGHWDYTYVDADAEVNVTFTINIPASEEYHTWLEEWTATDPEGHYHSCSSRVHEKDRAAHDTNGKGGACSVCGYLSNVTITIASGATTGTATGVYVGNKHRKLTISGLTEGHDYTVSCVGAVFSIGQDMGVDSYTLENCEETAEMYFTASGDEIESATITVTDEGEHGYATFDGEVLEVGTVSSTFNISETNDIGEYYKIEIATAGKYHFEWAGGATADTVWVSLYRGWDGEIGIDQVGDGSTGGETYELEAGTYYINIIGNWCAVSGTVTVKTGEAPTVDPTPAGITVTPEGGTGKVADGDGTVLTLSGFTVGKTYKIEVVNGNNIGVMIVGNSTFTYADGMTLTAKCMMSGGADAVFTIVEVVTGGETIALNKTYSVSGAAISNAKTFNIELAVGYYAIYDNGSVSDVTVNSSLIQMLNGSDTISSTAKVVKISAVKTYQIKLMKDSTFKVVSVPTLEITGGTVTISEANTFNNLYVLKVTSGAQKSITVPAGVEVLLNDKDLITEDMTAANFTPPRFAILAFKSSKTGDITVTIGDPIPEEESLPQLTPDSPLTTANSNAVQLNSYSVTVIQVGKGVAEGTYKITLNPLKQLLQAGLFFAKGEFSEWRAFAGADETNRFNPAAADYNPQAQVYVSQNRQAMKFGGGNDYEVSAQIRKPIVITLTLKAGDKLTIAGDGNASGTVDVTLEAVS